MKILSDLGFSSVILAKYASFFKQFNEQEIIFFDESSNDDFTRPVWERVMVSGEVLTSPGFWMEIPLTTGPIQNVLLFSSPVELMAYDQLFSHSLHAIPSVLIAIGAWPGFSRVRRVIESYPQAQITLFMERTFFGHLHDIYLACLLEGIMVDFQIKNKLVKVSLAHRFAELSMGNVSLENFCKASGFNTSVKTSKPMNTTYFRELLKFNGPL